MIKSIEYKKVNDNVDIDNIIDINKLCGSGKNVSIEAKLIDNKNFEIDDTVINLLTFKDNTGIINALIVTNKSDYVKYKLNNYYRVRGNIKIIDNIVMSNLNELLSKLNSNNIFIKDMKLLCVRSIQQINKKFTIKSIKLSSYYSNGKLIDISIPVSSIKILEIGKISDSLIYLNDGNYDNFNVCSYLELELYVNKLNKCDIRKLMSNINIFSITLMFSDNSIKVYNLPYYSKHHINNELQIIKLNNNIIYIDINEDNKNE